MRKLKAIDLFAGIGGVRLGLERAGFDVIYSNDFDKFCKITFENYFKEPLDTRKIEDVPFSDIPNDIDLLAAGFPCQPFSLAGLKRGFADPRGSLFTKVVDIIREKKPKAFLLENVKHLKRHDGGKTLDYMLDVLRNELGYYVPEPEILNSKNFGVPQNRERIYIVGFRDETTFKYPTGNEKIPNLHDILEEEVEDEFYFLSQKYLDCLIRHKNRHEKKGNGFGLEILDPEGISNTLVVGNMGRERNLIKDLHSPIAFRKNKMGVRKLTIRECARLQGFPKNFEFPVSRTQAYKQLGNTITIPVITSIGKHIKKSLVTKEKVHILDKQVGLRSIALASY
ncbi:MAG TPA: DNA (cytosine-5-)-methyltransferase [Patescibacteria group bacterium]|nr:DNA (cytosine-5-)-methyltransferase [Patescibacteria group bacterium]